MKYSLPDSAQDLLIKDGKLLMRSVSIYEVLRRFHHVLRMTAFRFEDFTAALLAGDQSALLAEIHIQLLRTLIREDRQQQTWLGPPDIRDSVNLYLQLLDHSNWSAALRLYLSADTYNNSHILDLIEGDYTSCYPFNANLETRLNILEQLCDQFLLSSLAREEINGGNPSDTQPDKYCRICAKADGELTICANCHKKFHLKCSYQTSEAASDANETTKNGGDSEEADATKSYTCSICQSNHVVGVTDCISEEETLGNLKRHEALGLDKLGRRYWFVIRRLFVVDETEDDVRYYTNVKQFREIMENLNENRYEKTLIENLTDQQEEIERQMKITEDLYQTLMKDQKNDDGSYALYLGQDGLHRSYTNNYPHMSTGTGKLQSYDRDITRNLNNKFCMNHQLKWFGAIDGHLNTITLTIRTTLLKFETQLPSTFIHPCWQTHRNVWIKSVNQAKNPEEFALALTKLETAIKPVLFKCAWYDSVGFLHLFRSTYLEREELKKIDRQPRGFERNERTTADFELSYRLGTMVKFSPKLKPVKHQVWKQKGEEYRLTGLNGWYWFGRTRQSRCAPKPKLYRNESYRWSLSMTNHPFVQDMINERIKSNEVIDVSHDLSQRDEAQRILYPKIPQMNDYKRARVNRLEGLLQKKLDELERAKEQAKDNSASSQQMSNGNGGETRDIGPITNGTAPSLSPVKIENGCKNVGIKSPCDIKQTMSDSKKINSVSPNRSAVIKRRLPPTHDFLTKRGKIKSIFVLPDLELRRLARSGGLKEARTFSYTAKQNHYVWPYGMTPRPTFRTCWLYKNELVNTIQDVSLQLKVINACIRWDDLQVKAPSSGHNVITTDEATITIELLKKRDKLPYLTHSEYLIRKTTTPTETPTKYRKIGTKKSTPSARSGLRARRQAEEEDEKGPTTEEIWVSEYQLELWELKQFDEKLERQNALIRERAQREAAEKKRRAEEEKRRAADQEKRRIRAQEEANKRARLSTPIITYQNPQKIATSATPPYRPNIVNSINIPTTPQQGSQTPTTPVLRYFRTEQGQIIRLPASYLQRGTPLILRHVSPGTNQTNTYILNPHGSPLTTSSPTCNNVGLRLVAPTPIMIPQVRPTIPASAAPAPVSNTTTAAVLGASSALAVVPDATPKSAASTVPSNQPPSAPGVGTAPLPTKASEVASKPAETVTSTVAATTTAVQALVVKPKLEVSTEAASEQPATSDPAAPGPASGPATDSSAVTAAASTDAILQPAPSQNHTAAQATGCVVKAEPDITTTGATGTAAEIEAKLDSNKSDSSELAASLKSGNENEMKESEQGKMSVGTVANEMAHDQHASPLVNSAGAQ